MIFRPGFTSALAAWVGAVLAVVVGHRYVPAVTQGLIAIAAGLVTHAHVTAKSKVPGPGRRASSPLRVLGARAKPAEEDPFTMP